MVWSLVSIYLDSLQLGIQSKQKYLDYWSRDTLNFDILENGREIYHILCMIFQEKSLSCYILLTD